MQIFTRSLISFSVGLALLCPCAAWGDTIYDISSSTSFGNNGFNQNGATTSFTDNMDGTFTLGHGNTGINNAVFVNSADSFTSPTNNINTLTATALGRQLVSSDTVIISGTVDSTTGFDLNANGIEFGVVSEFFSTAGTGGFRSNPNLVYQIDDAGNLGGAAPFYSTDFSAAGTGANVNRNDFAGITEASLTDGFSFTATYTDTSIVFEITDIIVDDTFGAATAGDTSLVASLDASLLGGYDLTDVGAGFGYLSFQDAGGGANYTLSAFQIDVVPEPSGVLILSVLSTGVLVRRRKR